MSDCSHEKMVFTDGPSMADPVWLVEKYCSGCGAMWSRKMVNSERIGNTWYHTFHRSAGGALTFIETSRSTDRKMAQEGLKPNMMKFHQNTDGSSVVTQEYEAVGVPSAL